MTREDSIHIQRLRERKGFVERFQKTILTLDRSLPFYHYERTHRGYHLRGRTLTTVFRGAVAA